MVKFTYYGVILHLPPEQAHLCKALRYPRHPQITKPRPALSKLKLPFNLYPKPNTAPIFSRIIAHSIKPGSTKPLNAQSSEEATTQPPTMVIQSEEGQQTHQFQQVFRGTKSKSSADGNPIRSNAQILPTKPALEHAASFTWLPHPSNSESDDCRTA